jgi:iron transport multicopper oxidase
VPDSLNPNVTSWLQYDSTKPFPIAQTVDMFDDFDDFTLVPYDKEPRLPQSTNPITLDLAMINLANGEN